MLEKLFPKKPKVIGTEGDDIILYNEEDKLVIHRRDEKVTGKEVRHELERYAKMSDFDIFDGTIEHAYESDFTGYTDHCPRCNAPTKQMYSGFVYATQTKPRVMTAPAGHFCTQCPTVIIDDRILRNGVSGTVKYGGTCALETGYHDHPLIFATFNGEKPVYILDDGESFGGIVGSLNLIKSSDDFYYDKLGMPILSVAEKQKNQNAQKKKEKNRSKNRAAKKSRSSGRKK
jgi:hypothetical protein